jgi:hypothetical protein
MHLRCACIIQTLALVLLLAAAGAAEVDDLLVRLDAERQERLYYNDATLSPAVVALERSRVRVAELAERFDGSTDHHVRFSVIVALGHRMAAGAVDEAERPAAIALLVRCLHGGSPWVRTEAVYALGQASAVEAERAIVRCLDDSSCTAVFHAWIAYRQIAGRDLPLTRRQRDQIERFQQHASDNAFADQELADWARRTGTAIRTVRGRQQ